MLYGRNGFAASYKMTSSVMKCCVALLVVPFLAQDCTGGVVRPRTFAMLTCNVPVLSLSLTLPLFHFGPMLKM